MSDLREAQSAVHIQLKPCKQRNQLHQEKIGNGQVKGQGPSIKYTTSYTLQNSLTQSLSLSLSISPHNTHLLFSLLLTDQQYRQYRYFFVVCYLEAFRRIKVPHYSAPTTTRLKWCDGEVGGRMQDIFVRHVVMNFKVCHYSKQHFKWCGREEGEKMQYISFLMYLLRYDEVFKT